MSRNRFQQLNRYFRCIEPWQNDDPIPRSTFDRVTDLTKHIWLTYRKLYTPSAYLAINETIKRFIGRAPEIVNILSKPIPEGFKIWVLANKGYILNWLWHARGNGGPVNLDESFTKDGGFLKTQAIVLNLITQRDLNTNKPLYPPRKHIIWLNNLFISVKLLTQLQELGVGGVGTVHTTKIK